jgi:hypothetical protein
MEHETLKIQNAVFWHPYLVINCSEDLEIWNMLRYYQQTLLHLRAAIRRLIRPLQIPSNTHCISDLSNDLVSVLTVGYRDASCHVYSSTIYVRYN